MAKLDDVEDPKAGAPAEGQDAADEIEAGSEGVQPEEQTETLEEKVARLEQERAEERRRKKQAQRQLVQLQTQLDEVTSRVGSWEQQQAQSRLAEAERSVQTRVAAAEAQLADAHEAGDAKAIAAAQRELTMATVEADRVASAVRQGRSAAPSDEQPTRRQPQPQVNPHAARWASRNAWYGNQSDPDDLADSYAAHAESAKLVNEGFDVNSTEYWAELDKRIARRLPHRFPASQKPAAPRPAATVAGAGRPVVGSKPGEVNGIPSAVLEAARLAGKPVDDPAFLARLRERVAETKTSLGIPR